MPVENSRFKGFYNHTVEERRALIAQAAGLEAEHVDALAAHGELDEAAASRMIENVIGTMSLPVGVATNFVIDGDHYVIPFCLEESSVVAAASNMAKRCLAKGGFRTQNDDPVMIGQLQMLDIDDISAASVAIMDAKSDLMAFCNDIPSRMISLGGGCKDIQIREISTLLGPMMIVHLLVDCRDAMGANAVNTMAERVAPKIEQLTGGRAHLRILSNLASHRLARVEATFTPEEMASNGDRESGLTVIEGILEAQAFAVSDPYRAATHNKGIMNAISSIALACGQDWRAIEAGCHAYTSLEHGQYTSMSTWTQNDEGDLVGSMVLPMAVGIVGGASKVHPAAKANLAILGVTSAQELAGIMLCGGLAQNLGALRALSTKGIQAGHMKLHAKNMAVSAGAVGEEIEILATRVQSHEGARTQSMVEAWLKEMRSQ
ncbi:MAG: hydroxymethylglutaryl-CoA reductase, degradative [Candidatus Poseidoniales archaeon]|nr:MAG: hydroxymethylglutaryl-CoA reductase, degradative [Candidatus Poseidoniales archaeon]